MHAYFTIHSSLDIELTMTHLFQPLKLRDVVFPNRVFLSPMCQYAAHGGQPTDWHMVHYGARAVGGVGLILLEATAVCPEGRITLGDSGLWSDNQVASFLPITGFIRTQGSIPGIQLAHAGRKASSHTPYSGIGPLDVQTGGWQVVSASPIPFSPKHPKPHELNAEELELIATQFASATKRALLADFGVVEIHMAHGYLLHSFLSPLSNHRTDDYGGSFENRVRFPLKVANRARKAWPSNLPLFVRISADDWTEGGWDLEQSIRFARLLRDEGVDLIDTSSGGLLPDVFPPFAPNFQVPFAEAIKKETGIATGAVGLITKARQANEILLQGQADAIFLGRELLRNPYWPLQSAVELGQSIVWPKAYLRANS